MKRRWELKPNLVECLLEERIAPAIANLGIIAQTTSGLTLVIPFPGAVSLGVLGGGAAATSAPSVSGTPMPSGFYMTARGVSTFMPGNITGNSAVAGAAATASGPGGTIQVGSGADDASAFSSPTTAASSRTNPGYNGVIAPTLAYIGTVSTSSVSAASSTGSTGTQTQSAPVPPAPSLGVVIPGSPSSMNGNPTNPMDPQSGAPRFMSGLTGKLVPTLPGGLGVQTNLTGTGPSGY
jgi:hypothetical protein